MTLCGKAARYFHTLRYLRPEQILGRIRFRLFPPNLEQGAIPRRRPLSGPWVAPCSRQPSLLGPAHCQFLNETGDIAGSAAWNDPARDKLWLYNLHYFDDLNAEGASERCDWHRALIDRWVEENPPPRGTGWEPYPTSLRIVNWIKWELAGNALTDAALASLALQARWLMRRLEWHLLGNHLFANAKALAFAGCFFEGPEAESWLVQGLKILARELPEQILADGGQFERSPMYHALALEDVLDLINVSHAFPAALPEPWRGLVAGFPEIVGRMRFWLAVMCHPDGEIAFFNDSAIGIAPSPGRLTAYAYRLGLPQAPPPGDGVTHLADSGYIRVQRGPMVALLDVAPVGPDYLPGHAHADTLSFELSLYGRRVLVNSGTSVYGTGPERLRQRGTKAHNTVAVDNCDSSEVWGGFRVARRAYTFGLAIDDTHDLLRIRCAHDGYRRLPGRPIHRREWCFDHAGLTILDEVARKVAHTPATRGCCDEDDRAYFHFHPTLDVDAVSSRAAIPEGRSLIWWVGEAPSRMVSSTYHPEFGLSQVSRCLEIGVEQGRCSVRFDWN